MAEAERSAAGTDSEECDPYDSQELVAGTHGRTFGYALGRFPGRWGARLGTPTGALSNRFKILTGLRAGILMTSAKLGRNRRRAQGVLSETENDDESEESDSTYSMRFNGDLVPKVSISPAVNLKIHATTAVGTLGHGRFGSWIHRKERVAGILFRDSKNLSR
jgi:hypothetical protein